MKKLRWALVLVLAFWIVVTASDAFARRSGGSFSGRGGFRSAPSRSAPSGSYRPSYGGGSNVVIMPGFGWGMGYGMGGSGFGGFGSLMVLGMLGLTGFYVYRSIRNAANRSQGYQGVSGSSYDDSDVRPERAYIYKLQLGLGRSARGLQNRLAEFAEEGDTASEAGLASLLGQTALELSRSKDSIRYINVSSEGPMPLAQGESRMNAQALSERSRFEVERVRGADGKVRKATELLPESAEVLEFIVVTVIIATRQPVGTWKTVTDHTQIEPVLTALGGVGPGELLGLEVIWTPADPGDSLTESDILTSYPDLKSV
jgi:uncharacterized membrane protein